MASNAKSLFDIEDDYNSTLAESIRKEIDNEILMSILVDNFKYFKISSKENVDLDWVKSNITNNYFNSGKHWVFEKKEDATLFALKWGDGAQNGY